MIISKTPYRISFLGGGTDYPAWYRRHGGAVLATTINKYCYITCRYLPPFFEHRIRVVYSQTEMCQRVDDIKHPAARAVLRYLDIERGIEIHHDGDLPARSGIGSSSSFTVGLLNALHALKGQMPSKKKLAADSIHIEQEVLREAVGSQDQVLAAYGGFNHVTFDREGEVLVRPMTLRPQRLEELHGHLMLFFTGIKRTAAGIASSYAHDLQAHERLLQRTQAMVNEGIELLCAEAPIAELGRLLHRAWLAKRSLSPRVSNGHLEEIYARACAAGAIGGKLLGAGGGGFFLFFVPPGCQTQVRSALPDLLHVPFRFESMGSHIIHADVEEDYAAADRARLNGAALVFRELDDTDRHSAAPAASAPLQAECRQGPET